MASVSQVLTHIRNALLVEKRETFVFRSHFVESILNCLKQEGIVLNFEPVENDPRQVFRVSLPADRKDLRLEQISKPGSRNFASSSQLARIGRGQLLLVSTSSGVMTGRSAIKRHLGGEVIVRIGRESA